MLAAMNKTLTLLAVAALAVAAVLTGCGGNGGQHTAVPTSTSAGDQVIRFAECMRQHGINLPDPAPGSDRITINPQGSTDAQIQAAQEACRKYRPEANNPHDGADSDRMVRLARCLRRHGVNAADPQPGQPLKLDDQGQDRQQLQQANQACQQGVG
jgi:hypothetical protein